MIQLLEPLALQLGLVSLDTMFRRVFANVDREPASADGGTTRWGTAMDTPRTNASGVQPKFEAMAVSQVRSQNTARQLRSVVDALGTVPGSGETSAFMRLRLLLRGQCLDPFTISYGTIIAFVNGVRRATYAATRARPFASCSCFFICLSTQGSVS
jgi:hypothetical protein